jgi:hypothetical protein
MGHVFPTKVGTMKIASVPAPSTGDGHVAYRGWSPCIEWCDANCEGPWLFISEGVFEFEWDRDYTMFMLRWA